METVKGPTGLIYVVWLGNMRKEQTFTLGHCTPTELMTPNTLVK